MRLWLAAVVEEMAVVAGEATAAVGITMVALTMAALRVALSVTMAVAPTMPLLQLSETVALALVSVECAEARLPQMPPVKYAR